MSVSTKASSTCAAKNCPLYYWSKIVRCTKTAQKLSPVLLVLKSFLLYYWCSKWVAKPHLNFMRCKAVWFKPLKSIYFHCNKIWNRNVLKSAGNIVTANIKEEKCWKPSETCNTPFYSSEEQNVLKVILFSKLETFHTICYSVLSLMRKTPLFHDSITLLLMLWNVWTLKTVGNNIPISNWKNFPHPKKITWKEFAFHVSSQCHS